MRGSAALVVLVVLGGLASETTSKGTSRDLRVGGTDTTAVIESTSTSVAPSTTVARSGAEDAAPPGLAPPADDADAPASGSRSGLSGVPAVGAADPTAAPARPAPTNAAAGAAPDPATAQGAPHVTTFGSQAGTVEVTYTDTSMNLESVSPLPGWSVGTTEAGDAVIEVTFESESGEQAAVDVEVHLDGGVPVVGADDETVDDVGDVVGGVTGS